jgi:nucleoside-diphosphate-sugar epimerase
LDLKTRSNQRAAQRFRSDVEIVWGDLCRWEDVQAAVRDQEVVVHLAFIIPRLSATGLESESNAVRAHAINVGGTRNLLSAMKAVSTPPKLVFSSSMHVYGKTQDRTPPRTASDPVLPTDHYARHKIACEQMIRASDLRWSVLRLAAAFPLALRLDPGMFDVPLDNRIEFVHTRDVGLALAKASRSEDVWGKTLLIGGGPSCQFYYRDLVQRVLDAIGVGMLPQQAFTSTPFDTDWLDTTESQRLLNYQQRDLDDYIQDMSALMGARRHLIRLFRPIVRRRLLRTSPYL